MLLNRNLTNASRISIIILRFGVLFRALFFFGTDLLFMQHLRAVPLSLIKEPCDRQKKNISEKVSSPQRRKFTVREKYFGGNLQGEPKYFQFSRTDLIQIIC